VKAAIARGVAVGAGGSRLLRGNDPEHEALEAQAAAFFRAESCLYFGSGFLANYALLSTLPARGDLIVHDELIHASVHDGMRASKAAYVGARHNDAQSFDGAIARWRAEGGTGRPWIAVESLYSMDGDKAPLIELMAVAERHGGALVIDEAHATGVLGPDGRGLGAAFEGRPDVVSLHTCGKALGVMGALVLLPAAMRDFLINRCRPFIYATAPSPLMAAAVRAALQVIKREPQQRERLAGLVSFAGRELKARCGITPSGSQIQPVIVGADERAVALAAAMQAQGFDIRAVRPPTVPEGTARLRISLTLNVDEAAISSMLDALARELARVPT
jgi:8-amino-7-oxononanoate synthase